MERGPGLLPSAPARRGSKVYHFTWIPASTWRVCSSTGRNQMNSEGEDQHTARAGCIRKTLQGCQGHWEAWSDSTLQSHSQLGQVQCASQPLSVLRGAWKRDLPAAWRSTASLKTQGKTRQTDIPILRTAGSSAPCEAVDKSKIMGEYNEAPAWPVQP